MTHNTDIAACGHATCPSREHCLRWVIGQRLDELINECEKELSGERVLCYQFSKAANYIIHLVGEGMIFEMLEHKKIELEEKLEKI